MPKRVQGKRHFRPSRSSRAGCRDCRPRCCPSISRRQGGVRATRSSRSLESCSTPADLQAGQFDLRFIHLIFDPGKKSHPEAEAIHGYSDWVLRHQEPFDKQAQLIVELVELADLVLAHNAPFDVEFVNRELTSSAKPPISKPSFCTMLAYRERVGFGSSKLSEATARIGL